MRQWLLRITRYADRLRKNADLEDLTAVGSAVGAHFCWR